MTVEGASAPPPFGMPGIPLWGDVSRPTATDVFSIAATFLFRILHSLYVCMCDRAATVNRPTDCDRRSASPSSASSLRHCRGTARGFRAGVSDAPAVDPAISSTLSRPRVEGRQPVCSRVRSTARMAWLVVAGQSRTDCVHGALVHRPRRGRALAPVLTQYAAAGGRPPGYCNRTVIGRTAGQRRPGHSSLAVGDDTPVGQLACRKSMRFFYC